ncbi:DNA polymerase III subunit alpha [Rhizosphaericola mali]|uniref:DNA-directed DNA polymerase n=1 Tax=Rhizosphaericola mali TaxID=2545455 RepID=A0A5P2G1X4_9BACT|nr:DNA polymerase III subunit alpha [Rhizosphaericola mali]QES89455.1 DNA polymerase III subunit alpha [Rhizosphaericola mali]
MLLNVHSYYSLRYGTLSIEQLLEGAKVCGYTTIVLTDINNTAFALEFIYQSREKKIKGLAGVEFRNEEELLFIGIAQSIEGFREMNELLTITNRYKKKLPECAPDWKYVYVIYPYGKKKIHSLKSFEYIGVRPFHLNKIRLEDADNYKKYVMWYPITYHRRGGYLLHKQLRAIDHNILLSQLEKGQYALKNESYISSEELLCKYKDFPIIIGNTLALLCQCKFEFDYEEVKNKQCFSESFEKDKEILLTKTLAGFSQRYGADNATALARIYKEIDIIVACKYAAYFLITDDICTYARNKGYYYVGRGSGANSVVAYCLGITEVDPIELNLYFERFLNVKRKNPPDFDIDFCWNQRDDVYSYIFSKYGNEHVALMGSMSKFKDRSIVRELGKIYGLPKSEIDQLVRDPNAVVNKNEVTNLIISVSEKMRNFPNQRTIHASGVLISERPLSYYGAIDYPPKGLPTVQFDMYTAEAINMEKLDVLSQRGIGHINDCIQIIQENKGEVVDVHRPKDFFQDIKIAQQLVSANTIGCFYIESPAMRQLLTKLECSTYAVLVAASSIIRPGVASSGMMKTYIECHRRPNEVKYLHPVFKEQLEETYGVMVYQEDVMKIGHHFGGLDLAEADVLRRMMNNKYREDANSEIIALKTKFFENCKAKGYEDATIELVWNQMKSFAGFSFNKAHSASYAVESYQSLFLKTYYPLEFMVAVLNNYGGFYGRKVYINEARKFGATIHLPDINKSGLQAKIYGTDIYLGWDGVLNLEQAFVHRLVSERMENGDYLNLENFIIRTNVGLEQMIVLIRCGAFSMMGKEKKVLLWEAHLFLSSQSSKAVAAPTLLTLSETKVHLPMLETSIEEDVYDEIELLELPITESMFFLAKSNYRGSAFAKDLLQLEGLAVRMVLDFICDKTVRTKNQQYMKFGTFLDMYGDFVDTIHFPPSLKAFPLNGMGLYLVEGIVVVDFGCAAVEVQRCAKMPLKPDPRSV